MAERTPFPDTYVVSRNTDDDAYGLWRVDLELPQLLAPMPVKAGANYPKANSLIWIGNYFLEWGPIQDAGTETPYFTYRLFPFDAAGDDPLAAHPLQLGRWDKKKFWGRSADFANPTGGHDAYDQEKELQLIPVGSFLLNFIPTRDRGTFALWNFDPNPTSPGTADPIPGPYSYTPSGSFRRTQAGDQLIPLRNYVLDRKPGTGEYALWSFDPQADIPLSHPAIQEGTWSHIGPERRLEAVGDHVLDWEPSTRRYRLWAFDPTQADPLVGPVREGTLPEGIGEHTALLGFQPRQPVAEVGASAPGTMDFLRGKIKHVVHYMIENRSFDHACGWLYENDAPARVIGRQGPFQGASESFFNLDEEGKKVFLSKFHDGKLADDYVLMMFGWDPYHENSDVLRQLFSKNRKGYDERARPDMGGFVTNNGSHDVMQTYSPEQLPILNGLAKAFAVSDEWFSSIPSGTDVNRAFSLTGSALMQLNNFMSPPQYDYWPEQAHRASIFKALWANGITDWKMYNSTEWIGHVFSYQLYLEGQIPTVDANASDYIQGIDAFYQDAANGTLPAFSYLEPIWIAKEGTTSYHPAEDIVPGEQQLNKIYEALRNGPNWEETLLVVTFDEHGGIFDHVPPPYAANPWPNDVNDGFRYDLMGVRIPTILVSPWIDEKTVFRSETDVAYESTSFLATLLHWYGVPRAQWFLGDRTHHAPTFEGVFTRSSPRKDAPALTPPHDKNYPLKGARKPTTAVHDLHQLVAHRAICAWTRGKLAPAEIEKLVGDVLAEARDLPALTKRLEKLKAQYA